MLPSDDPFGLDTGLPMLSKIRRLKLQAGTNLHQSGFLGDERPAWKATTDWGRPPIQVTLRMLGPMMRNAYRIVRADVLEELECHFAPHVDSCEHWPKLIGPFRRNLQLKKLTFGPTYSLAGLLSDFTPKPSLQELTFRVPEVADQLVGLLAKCKEDKYRRGRTRLPSTATTSTNSAIPLRNQGIPSSWFGMGLHGSHRLRELPDKFGNLAAD